MSNHPYTRPGKQVSESSNEKCHICHKSAKGFHFMNGQLSCYAHHLMMWCFSDDCGKMTKLSGKGDNKFCKSCKKKQNLQKIMEELTKGKHSTD